ncbi:restriction endonuclease [Lactococcus lactis]|uniref:restriction endonuclease n=1 Tax=Lactococcus lactis TaxID=1358 RepID=UPI002890A457|nr:restriction endonuclease [Lactococcus lactis]MDT2878816.1 restriction endonuclease [Lactococcus lactis]MDT2915856.1 restriction endonuclease [Lactococcus lactis]
MSDVDDLQVLEVFLKNPDIIKQRYRYTDKESLEINNLIDEIEQTQFDKTTDKGAILENLMYKIFNMHNMYKVHNNLRTSSNEIDLVLKLDIAGTIYKNNIQYLEDDVIVECKNYSKKVDVTYVGKFASLVNVSRCNVGLLISKKGITGRSEWSDAKGLIKKIMLRDGHFILDFNLEELRDLAGKTLADIINPKKDALKFDVDIDSLLSTHELEASL